jgi:hypothetical protein
MLSRMETVKSSVGERQWVASNFRLHDARHDSDHATACCPGVRPRTGNMDDQLRCPNGTGQTGCLICPGADGDLRQHRPAWTPELHLNHILRKPLTRTEHHRNSYSCKRQPAQLLLAQPDHYGHTTICSIDFGIAILSPI